MSVQTLSVSCRNEGSLLSLKRLSSTTAACYEWYTCDNEVNPEVVELGSYWKLDYLAKARVDNILATLILHNYALYIPMESYNLGGALPLLM